MATTENSANYCDGKSREFTVRFTNIVTGKVVYAAIALTTCSDPLDCLAMTEGEAKSAAESMIAYYRGATAEVVPLPSGWSNNGRKTGDVILVSDPVVLPKAALQRISEVRLARASFYSAEA